MQHKHDSFDFYLSLVSLKSVKKKEVGQISLVKKSKKGDFENPKVQKCNQSPISAVFPIVRFPGDPKTALTGDPLYFE